MLSDALGSLSDQIGAFRLFDYITFRTGVAVMTAMLISFVFGPNVIRWLRSRQGKGQPIREDGPEGHILGKAGTPTMGGLLILLSMTTAVLLWGDLANPFLLAVLGVTVGFGAIGFYDDYLKVSRQSHKGFSSRLRLLLEFAIAGLAVWAMMEAFATHATGLAIPFVKGVYLDLGWLFVPFGAVVIVGSANAVNLTDGLDGLAIVPVMIASMSFAMIAYLVGNSVFSDYLGIPFVPGVGEATVFLGAIIGASLGFLWFNAPPAMVFMGDTGSLALGGALGAVAVATKHELVLTVIGGLFVLEAVSVIVQVASFKLTGRRVFAMAPIHHHFEKKGWAEPTIVIRFWIIAIILALVGLSTLKLR